MHLSTAGHTNLPNVCPVCDHSPLSPDDCKANTALRTTVAVFLRTAEKKHNLLQQKEQKEKAKPIEPKVEIKSAELELDKIVPVHVSPVQNPLTPPQEVDDSTQAESQQALLQISQVSLKQPLRNHSVLLTTFRKIRKQQLSKHLPKLMMSRQHLVLSKQMVSRTSRTLGSISKTLVG